MAGGTRGLHGWTVTGLGVPRFDPDAQGHLNALTRPHPNRVWRGPSVAACLCHGRYAHGDMVVDCESVLTSHIA